MLWTKETRTLLSDSDSLYHSSTSFFKNVKHSKILFDFYDTIKINSKIKFLDNINEAMPGDNLNVEVELENNVPIFKDANFNIVEGNTKYATLTVTEIN